MLRSQGRRTGEGVSDGDLVAGAMLGHYRILSPLGAGGMGVVYLASDERLKRNVAVKILPDALVRDEGHLRRFVQEAQTASALNHPSIVTIYEIGTALVGETERHFIAMELIEGKTLRDYAPQKPGLKKLLPLFIDVAEGLARAHAAGVVHRDLKPENIMVTADGHAKIVDFGVSKLVAFDGEYNSNASTAMLGTAAGMILGTVGYMSPEQAEAGPVDHRSDIFSLGCVLYEAVSGSRAFDEGSVIATLHKIIQENPRPVHELNPVAPADLVRVIDRCLAKDPDERFQSVKEVAIELRHLLRGPTAETAALKAAAGRPRSRRWWPVIVLAALGAAAATTAAFLFVGGEPSTLSSYRFTPLATTPEYEGFPVWSPDGKTIAYVAESAGVLQVFTRSLTSNRRAQITKQPRDCREPFWSPDGSRIYFISVAGDIEGLWVVGAAGGTPQVVLPNVTTAAISTDGKTLAVLRESDDRTTFSMTLQFAGGTGAEPRRFSHPVFRNKTMTSGNLRFSPDGSKLGAWLFTRGAGAPREFWEISIPSMEPRQRLEVLGSIPQTYPFSWLPDNRHIVFGGEVPGGLSGSHLWLADTESNRLQPLTATPSQETYPSVSPGGKQIVFTTEEADFDLLEITLDGTVKPLLASSRVERMPAWAPDGSYAFATNRSGTDEIWLRSVSGDFERPLVSAADFTDGSAALFASVAFSPDGQRIAYQRSGGTYRIWISSTAGGAPVPLNQRPLALEDHPTWSPDGEWLAFAASGAETEARSASLMKVRVGTDAPPVVVLDGVIASGDMKWSPTGEWIACETPEGMIVVSPDGTKKRLLVDDSWLSFAWSKDGRSLYAIRNDDELRVALVRVDVATAKETIVADLGISPPTNHPFQGLSLNPDGTRLATSVVRLRGDLWLLEGWAEPRRRFSWPQ